jgi:purine-nucleoside/S-methyl-5'-thioadenosine phosphorylase / adenosine deaminase
VSAVDLLRFPHLSTVPGVVHGVSTRAGGVSDGRCESLNVSYSVGDDAANVDTNLDRVADAVGTRREDLFAAYQVHGREVTLVSEDTAPRPRCDVLITRSPAKTLMLRFADCAPVLLAEPRQRVVALAHAGWRGTAARAAGAAVEALADGFGSRPSDIVAGVGPAIGPCCYEVGADVLSAFEDRAWLFSGGKLDLWEANRQALIEAGVPPENIEVAGICTRCQSKRFFSHRANGGQPAGRFAALIRLT